MSKSAILWCIFAALILWTFIVLFRMRLQNTKREKDKQNIELVKQRSQLYKQYTEVKDQYGICVDIPESYFLLKEFKSWKTYSSADVYEVFLILVKTDPQLENIYLQIKQNRENLSDYKKAISLIPNIPDFPEQALPISQSKYMQVENKLIEKMKNPPTDIKLNVSLRYYNRQGEFRHGREGVLGFEDLENAYQELKQRDRKKTIVAIERAKMSDDLRYQVFKRDGFRCTICGATASDGIKLHVDHIKPVSKGGKTEMDNLRTLCERCNLGKGAKYDPNGSN